MSLGDYLALSIVDELISDTCVVPVVAGAVVPDSCLRHTATRPTTPFAQVSAKSAVASAPRKYIARRSSCQPQKSE